MKKKRSGWVLTILSLVSFLLPVFSFSEVLALDAKTIDNPKYILYIPSNIDFGKKYPLVVAFSPSADAQSMINTWTNVAERYKWIILASKEFRNGLTYPILPNVVSIINELSRDFPIDLSKVIATGLSGGGMCSYFFAFEYPQLISAVISNVGVIHQAIVNKEGYEYTRRKLAVFLASPDDFNYEHMKEDKRFLEGLDWKTKWIEFKGGHTTAPDSAYQEAAEWLKEQFR